ncbi:MAG: DUF1579 family protein [Chromatiales bacterium]
MKTDPQKEHEWLQKLVGEWTFESECSMEPGKSPEKFKGSESVPSLEGIGLPSINLEEQPMTGLHRTALTTSQKIG